MLTMTVAAPSKKMDIKPVLSLFSRLLSFGMILNGKAKTEGNLISIVSIGWNDTYRVSLKQGQEAN